MTAHGPAAGRWREHAAPVSDLTLTAETAPGVCVVMTVGDGRRRPDLGYNAGGGAVSPGDRGALAAAVGVPAARLVFMEQVHGAAVAVVTGAHAGSGFAHRSAAVAGVDALVTTEPELALVGLSADCPLVALWDEAAGVCGLAHAGWRGLAAGVVAALAERMAELGATASRLGGAIGPAIGPCCYEVGRDVARCMPPEHVHRRLGRTMVDLRGAAAAQLSAAGVNSARVAVHRSCTRCDERFHSYRRDGPAAGRQAVAVCLRGSTHA